MARLSPLASLPTDIVLDIASFLSSRSDILNLSTSSSFLYTSAIPAIYASVTLNDTQQCMQTLTMLANRGDIARHVRKLVVRPDGGKKYGAYPASGVAVSAAVKKAARKLDALNTFVWDGDEMPACDEMWLQLRMLCPQLRTIGTSIGQLLVASHLFQFKNLKGFSLTFKGDARPDRISVSLSASSRLWNMLIDRSPDLEELCIDGFSPLHSTGTLPLIHARWPKLRKLTLGDGVVDLSMFNPIGQDKHPFIAFLDAHPKLESLRTSRHALPPAQLATLDPTALPVLKEFSGTLEQLQTLATHHTSLTSVVFHEPMLMRDVTPLAVSATLQEITSLTTLRISFVLYSMYESGSLLRSLVGCCPNLVRLELVCGHKPSFPIESLAKEIRHLTRLRTLDLSIVKFPGDASLATNAVLLARTNPRLSAFTITYIPSNTRVPTLSSGSPGGVAHSYLRSGTFTMVPDEHGLPVCLLAVERSMSFWGSYWPLGAILELACGPYRGTLRRYRIDLRPGPASGRRRCQSNANQNKGQGPSAKASDLGWGWRWRMKEGRVCAGVREFVAEFMELVRERSAAGEELRMVLFLVVLVVLAVWAFLFVESGRALGGRGGRVDGQMSTLPVLLS